jgi:hypothetical protein
MIPITQNNVNGIAQFPRITSPVPHKLPGSTRNKFPHEVMITAAASCPTNLPRAENSKIVEKAGGQNDDASHGKRHERRRQGRLDEQRSQKGCTDRQAANSGDFAKMGLTGGRFINQSKTECCAPQHEKKQQGRAERDHWVILGNTLRSPFPLSFVPPRCWVLRAGCCEPPSTVLEMGVSLLAITTDPIPSTPPLRAQTGRRSGSSL